MEPNVSALTAALRDCVANNGERVKDVFTPIDKDGSGSISCKDFIDGVLGLELSLTKEQIAELDGALAPPPTSLIDPRATHRRPGRRRPRRHARRRLGEHQLQGAGQNTRRPRPFAAGRRGGGHRYGPDEHEGGILRWCTPPTLQPHVVVPAAPRSSPVVPVLRRPQPHA